MILTNTHTRHANQHAKHVKRGECLVEKTITLNWYRAQQSFLGNDSVQ